MTNYKQKIKKFINKKSSKQKIIVIYGPTGSGKTGISIDIAKFLDTEIISTDSRQIFKYMDIGTGKITEKEKGGVIHHMIDIITPNQEYSVGEFKNKSEEIIKSLHDKGKIPILCGGTGLYIDSLIYDFNIPKIPSDNIFRAKLEKEAEINGKEYIFDKLKYLDPEYDRALHVNNLRYVIRALEVKILTGKSKTSFKGEKKLKYDVLFLTPYNGNREELYFKINKRVLNMFDLGLLDEIKGLFTKGYKESDFGMNSIGYNEIYEYLKGKITLEETIKQVQQNTRNYAKRQLTRFRKYEST